MKQYYIMKNETADFIATSFFFGSKIEAIESTVYVATNLSNGHVYLTDGLTGEIIVEFQNGVMIWVEGIGNPFEILK